MDITKLSTADLAYLEGFVKSCADRGVDPEQLLAKMAQEGEEQESERGHDKPVRHVAGGAGKGALAGGAIGAGLGALHGAYKGGDRHYSMNKATQIKHILKGLLGGAIEGGVGGATAGALTGGVVRAVQ